MNVRYFVRALSLPWAEVSMEDFVRAERAAGFHNTLGRPDLPATGGFGNGSMQGCVVYDVNTADQYGWDPELQAVAFPSA